MHRTARTLLLLLPLLATACTTAAGARRAALRRALDQTHLSRSPAEVWTELERFLHERGFPLVGEDRLAVGLRAQGTIGKLFSFGYETRVHEDGSRILETDLEPQSRTRVRAEALAAAGDGCRLRLTVMKQSDTDPSQFSEYRDEALELALLERLDPVAAARVQGKEPPPAAAVAARPDAWAPVRPLVGSWEGALPGGAPVRWRFDFVAGGQFMEVKGSPLLFVGPTAGAGAGEELGRISRQAAGDQLEWHQFTLGGQVDRYRLDLSRPGALVLLAEHPESLPAGTRVRLTLGRDGDREMVAILERAEPGKDFAVAGEVRLKRAQ